MTGQYIEVGGFQSPGLKKYYFNCSHPLESIKANFYHESHVEKSKCQLCVDPRNNGSQNSPINSICSKILTVS